MVKASIFGLMVPSILGNLKMIKSMAKAQGLG